MKNPSNQANLANSLEIPENKQSPKTTPTMSPICKLSPSYNGSTLYDSYELRAVAHQLNKAIQGSKLVSPPYFGSSNSPFYRKRLDLIHQESQKSPRGLPADRSKFSSATNSVGFESKVSGSNGGSTAWAGTRGVVTRLWKKVKQGLMRTKQ